MLSPCDGFLFTLVNIIFNRHRHALNIDFYTFVTQSEVPVELFSFLSKSNSPYIASLTSLRLTEEHDKQSKLEISQVEDQKTR